MDQDEVKVPAPVTDDEAEESEEIGEELEADIAADNVNPSASPEGEMPDGN